MTLLIEPAIVEKLIQSLLFASFKHSFEGQEDDFGNQKLVMMSIMTLHGRLFHGDFRNAIVIGAI